MDHSQKSNIEPLSTRWSLQVPAILLIEDDISMRSMMIDFFAQKNYTLNAASSGSEALKLIKEKRFDLVITDIIMDNQDGLEVIRAIKNSYPEIKVIAISGGGKLSAEIYLKIASLLGAISIFQKPFSMNDLLNEINNIFQ
ncbi:MAG: response regulator [Fibrobacterota bacterium]|nr:response regulator [Chitinispirillaceae bacterium]